MVKAYVNNGMAQPISDTVQIERVSSVPNPTEVLGIRELQIANASFVDLEPISLSVEGKYITATQIIVNSGSLYLAETDGVTPPTNSMSTEVAEGSIISLYTDPAKVFLKAKTATSDIVIKYLSGNKGAEIGSKAGSSTLLELQAIKSAIEKTVATGAGKTPVIGAFSPAVPPAIFQPISSAVFEPIAGRDFNIQVIFDAGVTGNVQLEQSLDGTNFYPPTGSGVAIMRFSSNAVEQWSNSEVGAKFRLSCTAIAGGTINYRISQ